MLDTMLQDARYAIRSLRKSPIFTGVVLVTLIAGVAAVTSIFSYLNAIAFAPLPYHDQARIVGVGQAWNPRVPTSTGAAVRLVRESARSFDRVAVFELDYVTMLFGDEPKPIQVLGIDTSFIPMLALRPQFGRLPSPEEILTRAPVAAISSVLWRAQYGGDSSALGKVIPFEGTEYTIVGVMPEGFRYPYQTDAFLPLAERDRTIEGRDEDYNEYMMIGRLRPGVTRDAARAEMNVLATRLPKQRSVNYRKQFMVLDEMLVRPTEQFLPGAGLFLGAGLFVLLIACANVANLFMARGAERRSEMAIRASLGASQGRLVRQALMETFLLGGVAAVVGTALSFAFIKIGLSLIPTQGFPSWFHVVLDWRVLAFALGLTLLVTLAAGLSPAREGTRLDLAKSLKVGGDTSSVTSRVMRGASRGLTVQLAFAVALFVSAALLVRSYQRLHTVDFGYPAERIVTVHPFLPSARYPDAESRARFALGIAADLKNEPIVGRIAVRGFPSEFRTATSIKPRAGEEMRFDSRLIPDGDSTRGVRQPGGVRQIAVTDDYFAILELEVLQGRAFLPSDQERSAAVAVISAEAAKVLWPGQIALGHTVQAGVKGEAFTVIGVVEDVRDMFGGRNGMTNAARPIVYYSARQALLWNPVLVANGRGEPAELHGMIAKRVRAADPLIMVGREITMADQLDESFMITRIFGGMLGAFAAAALALSMIGIYGVVAFGVARRVREIGVRIALGATRDDVLRLIIGGSTRFMIAGLVIGLGFAALLGRVLGRFLYGVSPLDPVAYGAVCVLFAIVVIVASYLPARRATRVDPLVALRAE